MQQMEIDGDTHSLTDQPTKLTGIDFSLGCIKQKASKAEVQHTMNVAIGYTRWYGGRKDLMWINLLAARNKFVEYHIQTELSITQYKQLELSEKQDQVQQLCKLFIKEFLQHTRDNSWMQEAVGEDFSWVHIKGMSDWHSIASGVAAMVSNCIQVSGISTTNLHAPRRLCPQGPV
ncbi:hypothetical protein HYALB_00012566 [Hymenoscyphus albidus]|uniref:Uncharacterized protein n=1 Tax=Hymenoscyphus albidus TaxID=595503 RepID=A0A9N9Q540_9HELO|nr:hypothetical protein HYALB_00012566 [Hymenoscyphus albidus]